jgi:hypothetical protein
VFLKFLNLCFDPPDPEEVLGAEDPVPQPQPDEPPEEVDVPQLVVDMICPLAPPKLHKVTA